MHIFKFWNLIMLLHKLTSLEWSLALYKNTKPEILERLQSSWEPWLLFRTRICFPLSTWCFTTIMFWSIFANIRQTRIILDEIIVWDNATIRWLVGTSVQHFLDWWFMWEPPVYPTDMCFYLFYSNCLSLLYLAWSHINCFCFESKIKIVHIWNCQSGSAGSAPASNSDILCLVLRI